MKNPTERELQNFVSNNILLNQTHLVQELLNNYSPFGEWDNILNLYGTCDDCDKEEGKCGEHEEPQEIFEWWAVTNWMAKQLATKGEPILSNDFGTWWGRTTTGQMIAMDSVIANIYNDPQ